MQGALGDCWFVSALAVLAQFGPDLLRGLFVSSHPVEGLYPFNPFTRAPLHRFSSP
jgi:hypothetical protein